MTCTVFIIHQKMVIAVTCGSTENGYQFADLRDVFCVAGAFDRIMI